MGIRFCGPEDRHGLRGTVYVQRRPVCFRKSRSFTADPRERHLEKDAEKKIKEYIKKLELPEIEKGKLVRYVTGLVRTEFDGILPTGRIVNIVEKAVG